jgi:hypothetical protein
LIIVESELNYFLKTAACAKEAWLKRVQFFSAKVSYCIEKIADTIALPRLRGGF